MKLLISYLIFSLAIVLWTSECCNAQKLLARKNLQEKEIFSAGFPRTLSFRNDKVGLREGYDFWENIHLPFNSITKKYLKEEVDMDPVFAAWANKYAKDHSGKLMLLHLNGEGRSVNDSAMHQNYFPGHWIYEAGTIPLEDIDRTQKVIQLQTAKPFKVNAYTVHGNNANAEKLPHDLIIVELDEKGNRIWDKSEFATIEKVDYKNNSITVKRGQYQSTRRDFTKGRTYIAPLAGDSWGGNLMWYYNLSSCCPLDRKGKSCADVFVDEIANWYSPDGILNRIDGIGFDVNYFVSVHETWDCNNDGVADKGIIDGENLWRKGDLAFLNKLRKTLGEDFIIMSDGWRNEMQRAVGILNGMETEGLCRPNDGYRQISRTINQHIYWNKFNTSRYQFSYITSKLKHPDDMKIETQLHRMGIAIASCLGVSYAYSPPLYIPEIFGGDLNKANWLGNPTSELKYAALETPDLLNNAGKEMNETLVHQFDFHNANYKLNDNTLYIKGTKENVHQDIIIPGPEIKIPSGDLILFFEAKAIQGFAGLEDSSAIPRKINVRIEGFPAYPAEEMNADKFHNELAGFMGTQGFAPVMFYFRNVGNSENPIKLFFEVEEQGEFAIRNLRIYNAPSGIYREFENGVVLVNLSFSSLKFDLDKIFEKEIQYKRLKAVIPTRVKLDGSIKEVVEYNNGEIILSNNEVSVPGLNALFLIKINP